MKNSLLETQQMLAAHHRDGTQFAEMMKSSYSARFDQKFWDLWQDLIAAQLNDTSLILDLGTGPGSFLVELGRRYPSIQSIGVECAQYMLQAMEKLPAGAEIMIADLHDPRLPLQSGSVDVAVASVVLHEMVQPVKTFIEMFRCLQPGGLFYILDWVRVPLQQ